MISRLASTLRQELQNETRNLSPIDRLELAQRLGDEAAATYARAHNVTADQAAQEFARRRQLGRRPSRCAATE